MGCSRAMAGSILSRARHRGVMTFLWRAGDRPQSLYVYSIMLRRAGTLLVCLILGAPAAALEPQRPLPDAAEFLREARKRLDTDDERQRGYMYVETRRDQKLDKNGRPTANR